MSRISVIIPHYNRGDLLCETLRCVFAQTKSPYEVIVVDDGSTDGSFVKVEDEFGSRIKLYRQENAGAGPARNRGFQASSGEYIQFMDSDDLPSPNSLQVQVEALIRSNADITYGPWLRSRIKDNVISLDPVVLQQRPAPKNRTMLQNFLRGWMTVLQPCLLRRSAVEKAGLYRTDLKPTEDLEFLFRIFLSGGKAVHTPESLLLYRVHPEGQVSIQNSANRSADLCNCLETIRDQFATSHLQLDRKTRSDFDIRCAKAIRELKMHGGVETSLTGKISLTSRCLEAAVRPWNRLTGAINRRRFGGNYSQAFAIGKVNSYQRKVIHEMGFTISDQ